MMAKTKKCIAVMLMALVGFAMISAGAVTGTAEAASDADKAAKKASNGFMKSGSSWYYVKSHKLVKGLKKIGGKWYLFAKDGKMQSGAKKIKGKNYFFEKVKTGKSKGQAPALANAARKSGKKAYFYNKKGVRYEYAFKNVGNDKANSAAGVIISGAKVKAKDSNEKKLEKAYRQILTRCGYGIVPGLPMTPNLKSKTWVADYAYSMAFDKKGKCFGYGSLTGLTARALGFKTAITVGKAVSKDLKTGKEKGKYDPHAWATIKDGGRTHLLDTNFDDNKYKNGKAKKLDFFNISVELDGKGSFEMTTPDAEYSYTGGKNF